jgi:acyl-CoA thioesterase I
MTRQKLQRTMKMRLAETKPKEQKSAKKTIIFFGNSLTAGYGLDPDDAFPALIQKRLDSLGMKYTVVNAGVSGETTATGVNRVDWVITQNPPDIFVLELGGNDGLRGIPVEETKKNLLAIIEKVRGKYPACQNSACGHDDTPEYGAGVQQRFYGSVSHRGQRGQRQADTVLIGQGRRRTGVEPAGWDSSYGSRT